MAPKAAVQPLRHGAVQAHGQFLGQAEEALGRLALEQRDEGQAVAIESVGGVDAAKRVQAGEAFDVVILASDAVDRLVASGHVQPGSRVDLVRSPVAVAVRAAFGP